MANVGPPVSSSADDEGWHPLSAVERAMARRMAEAAAIPIASQWADVRVDAATAVVKRLRAEGVPATFNAIVVHAIGLAVLECPGVAAELDYETWRKRVPSGPPVRIGVAVAAPRGLLVPGVTVSDSSLDATARELDSVVQAVRSGASDRSLFAGARLTVSNIGSLGIHGGFPTPTPGQSAIVGVASARPMPVVENGELTIGTISNITVTIDHRAVDGMTSAKFLRRTIELIERPELMAR